MYMIQSVSRPIILLGTSRNIFEFCFMFKDVDILGYSADDEASDITYDIPCLKVELEKIVTTVKQGEALLVICDVHHEKWDKLLADYGWRHGEQFLWFEDFFESLNRFHEDSLYGRQIAVWGIGDTQANLQRELERQYKAIKVSCYIDGDDAGSVNEMNGLPVYHVADIEDISRYFVIVASVYYFEIKNRLQSLGLKEEQDFLPFSAFMANPRDMMKQLVAAPQRKEFYCTNPYTFFYYAWFGAYPCCSTWVRYPIGNPMTEGPEACWNSVEAKLYRLSAENRTYCFCIPEACELWHEHLHHAKVQDWQVPALVTLGLDYTCNLHCSSCRNEPIIAKGGQLSLREAMADRIIATGWLEKTDKLELSGAGEALFSKVDRAILFSGAQHRNSISLMTNGLLLTRENCELLVQHYQQIDIKISIDAATEETYLKIRRGGNWQRLMKNLALVSEYRKDGRFHYVEIRMVVQRDNYMEVPDFIKMCKAFQFDKVYLTKLLNWDMYSNEEYEYQSMIDSDGRMDEALRRIFNMPEVDDPVVSKTQFLRYLSE